MNERFFRKMLSTVSTESTESEIEFEIYIRGGDVEAVKNKSLEIEYQKQFSFFKEANAKTASSSGHRIRYSVYRQRGSNEVVEEYVYTMKIRDKNGHTEETNFKASSDDFKQFKLVSDNCFEKTRYKVPAGIEEAPDAVFEFDVNPKSPWIKIDLEVPLEHENLDPQVILSAIEKITSFSESFLIAPSFKSSKPELTERATKIVQEYFVTEGPFDLES